MLKCIKQYEILSWILLNIKSFKTPMLPSEALPISKVHCNDTETLDTQGESASENELEGCRQSFCEIELSLWMGDHYPK